MFLPAENALAEVVNWTFNDSGSASPSLNVATHHLRVSRATEPAPSWCAPDLSKNTPPRFQVSWYQVPGNCSSPTPATHWIGYSTILSFLALRSCSSNSSYVLKGSSFAFSSRSL